MAGSDHACDPRNSRPCSVLDRRLSDKAARNLFSGAEIDFFGPEVTPRAFVDLMIGRGTPDAPPGVLWFPPVPRGKSSLLSPYIIS